MSRGDQRGYCVIYSKEEGKRLFPHLTGDPTLNDDPQKMRKLQNAYHRSKRFRCVNQHKILQKVQSYDPAAEGTLKV